MAHGRASAGRATDESFLFEKGRASRTGARLTLRLLASCASASRWPGLKRSPEDRVSQGDRDAVGKVLTGGGFQNDGIGLRTSASLHKAKKRINTTPRRTRRQSTFSSGRIGFPSHIQVSPSRHQQPLKAAGHRRGISFGSQPAWSGIDVRIT